MLADDVWTSVTVTWTLTATLFVGVLVDGISFVLDVVWVEDFHPLGSVFGTRTTVFLFFAVLPLFALDPLAGGLRFALLTLVQLAEELRLAFSAHGSIHAFAIVASPTVALQASLNSFPDSATSACFLFVVVVLRTTLTFALVGVQLAAHILLFLGVDLGAHFARDRHGTDPAPATM